MFVSLTYVAYLHIKPIYVRNKKLENKYLKLLNEFKYSEINSFEQIEYLLEKYKRFSYLYDLAYQSKWKMTLVSILDKKFEDYTFKHHKKALILNK